MSAAGTAYSINAQNEAVKAANSARPAPFVPVDIGKTAQMAFIADKSGYDISDADWRTRFPKLAAGRDYNINDMAGNLSGVMSPNISSALDKSGLSANLNGNEFQQAKALGQPILAKEQRDRNYFQKLLGDNPQRSFGLSGQDVTHISLANTGGANVYAQGAFGSNINRYNSQIAQNIQNTNAEISGLGSLAGLLTQGSGKSGYLEPSYYNSATTGEFGRFGGG